MFDLDVCWYLYILPHSSASEVEAGKGILLDTTGTQRRQGLDSEAALLGG